MTVFGFVDTILFLTIGLKLIFLLRIRSYGKVEVLKMFFSKLLKENRYYENTNISVYRSV